ncbi:DUF6294 family protein [Nonomuraea sp. M3C6]|uniref:DUF6294 family protein n=1 Tax=Nonomuraea marmarensis TaxID=3351344 RepID=A0ABW7AQJ9_9ACTN
MKRVALGVAALAAALTVACPAVAASPASAAPASASTGVKWTSFDWDHAMTTGACRISKGAKWTLYSNGQAHFDARVSSAEGDDAWLMWASLLDNQGAVLGEIRVSGSRSTKFVQNLPRAYWLYRWQADGQFDARLYDQVDSIVLSKHC